MAGQLPPVPYVDSAGSLIPFYQFSDEIIVVLFECQI